MRILHKTLLVLLILSTNLTSAQEAEFIWAEDDRNGSQIYLSQHINGSWQSAEKIVDDTNLNILPTIGSGSKGQRIAVWSMVDQAQSVLKYSIKLGTAWSTPRILSNQMSTNLAPVVVFDHTDVCWVFWSANNGGDDDILVSKFINGQWTQPEQVNDENETPDILPETGLDDVGNVWVSWQNLENNSYIDRSKSFASKTRRKMTAQNSISMQDIKQIQSRSDSSNTIGPPKSFKARSRATLHYPKAKNKKSKLVKGNKY